LVGVLCGVGSWVLLIALMFISTLYRRFGWKRCRRTAAIHQALARAIPRRPSALLLGYRTRLAAAVLAAYCVATAMFFHRYVGDLDQQMNFLENFAFLKNFAIAGGLLQIIAYGAGSFSLDAIRRKSLRNPEGCSHDQPSDPRSRQGSSADAAEFRTADYRLSAVQVASIASMDRRTLVTNIVSVARTAKLYGLPIVLSTVNVKTGRNQPTIHQLQEIFPKAEALDRTTINAWEDTEFVKAVKATGRKKLVMTALWTEACLTFPALDALSEGYEVYPVVDAVGGTSPDAHRAALDRIVQAGAKAISWVQLICELQRDWLREETVPEFANILFVVEGR